MTSVFGQFGGQNLDHSKFNYLNMKRDKNLELKLVHVVSKISQIKKKLHIQFN